MKVIEAESKAEAQARATAKTARRFLAETFGSRLLRGGRLTKWKGITASYAPNLALFVSTLVRPRNTTFAALAFLASLVAGPAGAADRYWDTNGTTPGLGGTGTWNTSSALWNNQTEGGPMVTWNNGALDDAFFVGTPGAIGIGAPITVHNMTFGVSGYTLSGGTLTLGGTTPTISVVSGASATINSIIAGSAGLTKADTGTLTLGGANTFSGGVNVNAGTLVLNGTSSFTGDVNVANGAFLEVGSDTALGAAGNRILTTAGATLTINNTLSAGRVVLGGGGQTTVQGSGATTTSFSGAGGLTAAAETSLANNASNYTGQTIFQVSANNNNSGFGSVGNLGQASALGAATDPTNGTIIVQRVDGSTGNLSYTGTGSDSDRNWQIVANTGNLLFQNTGTGTLTLRGGIAFTGSGSTGTNFRAVSADLELLGQISGNPAFVNFTGSSSARTITLGGANSFNAPVTISAVTVKAGVLADGGANSSLGVGTSVHLASNSVLSYTGAGASSNRTWTFDGSATISNDGTGALSFSGAASPVVGGAAIDTLTLGGSHTGTNTFSGVISGTSNLGSSGAGTWVLNGANTRTGSIAVNGGTLRAGNASAFGTTTTVTVNSGTLDLNGFNLAATSLAGSGGTVALGSGNLTVNSASNSTFAGSITGAGGSLTKLGAGTLTLTGANSYTGATSIGGGTLALDFAATSGGPTSNLVSDQSTLNMGGGTLNIVGAASEANSQAFNGLNITAGSNTLRATSGTGGSLAINVGAITRTGGQINFFLPTAGNIATTNADGALGGWATVNGSDYAQVTGGFITAFTAYVTKDDASTWLDNEILSDEQTPADSPFFGTVSGSKQIGGLKYTAAAGSTVTIGPGNTLGVDGTIIVAPSVGNAAMSITGGSLTGVAGGGTLAVMQNGGAGSNYTIASTIVDNGGAIGFTKSGTGLVTLTGPNTYTGPTTVSAGVLSVNTIANGGSPSAIGASSNASSNLVLQGGTLSYTGASTSSDRGFTLATNGAVSAGTVDVSQATTNLQFSGVVTSPDNAGLTKTGLGTLTLSNAASTYTGVTTVSQGTLAVSTLANGGANSSIGASSNASSNLVLQGGGELEYTGGTASSNRGFTLGTGGGAIDVAQSGTVLTLSGVATGGGTLTKNGAGTLVLSGTNNYSGGTVVSAGTLRAGSTSAFGSSVASMTVNTGATLDLAGFNNSVGSLTGGGNVQLGGATLTLNGNGSFSGVISGAGSGSGVTINGTQTFSGCGNTYQGPTTIGISATLTVSCLANGGSPSSIGASSSASTNLRFQNGTLVYTGGDVTTDRGFSTVGSAYARIVVQNAGTTLTFGGAVTGAGASVIKDGPGTLVLSGTNTYGSGTTVSSGTLRAGSTSAFGGNANAGPMTVNAGATLDLAGQSNTVASLAGSGNVTLGTATITLRTGLDNGGNNQTFSGTITGDGGLVKDGTGTQTQTLSGLSSYTGSTLINGGILAVTNLANGGGNSSIGASAATPDKLVLNGGTLQYIGAGGSTDRQFTLGTGGGTLDASGTGAINFTSTAAATLAGAGNRTLTLTGASTANNTLSALLANPSSGATSLTKTGSGTWILTNQNSTYTGVTTISGGVLGVDKLADGGQASSIGSSLSDASNLVIGSGSTLRYTGSGDTTNRLFTLSTGVSFIESSGTGAIVFSNTGSALYTGVGPRTFALGGTNTGLNTMGGTIIDGPGGATTLAKNDSGTWVLTGNNSYSGNTVINDGNLIIGNGGVTGNAGTGDVIVDKATSTLSFNRSDMFNFAGTLSGPGSIAQIGTGTTRLTSATNSIGNVARVDAGVLQVDGGLTAGSVVVNAGELRVSSGGTLTTPTIAMNAGSTLTVNGTAGAAAGATAAITGDAGASTITVGAGGILRATGDLGGGSDAVRLAGTLNTGAGTLGLGDGNDTLTLSDGGAIAGGVTGGAGTDTLQVDNAAAMTLQGGSFFGFESLNKTLGGTLTLTGNHSYGAGTSIAAGTLQIGNGATAGALATPTVANNGTLAFNLDGNYSFAGAISGSGGVDKLGAGVTTLTGTNSYAGATNVNAGTLLINGNQSGATGLTSVASGASLGGLGIIGGSVTVAGGGTLSPGGAGNAPGELAITGNLTLNDGSILAVNFGQAGVVGGPLNDLVTVGGNLTLDGTLNITQTPGGTFGPGVYRIFNYGGALTDNGLAVTDPDYFVQTAIANQLNLVNSEGLTLSFWDGDAGPHSNSAVNGGNGTWRAGGDQNWTDSTGLFAAPFANASFAIFQGAAGTVAVDNANGQVQALGMQFATGGYVVGGDGIELVDDSTQAGLQSVIRVGDGTAAGLGYVATINSVLSGNTQLVKTDLGTLVLSGANTYTTGTAINGGTLQVSSDANLGAASGALSLDGGTLRNMAAVTSARTVTLNAAGGTFETIGTLTLTGAVGGAGALTKIGADTLVLNGTNTYQGGTVINDGTVQISADANLGNAAGGLTFDGGTLRNMAAVTSARSVTLNAGGGTFDTVDALTLNGTVGGAGALSKTGAGTLVLTGTNTYAGGTTIDAGTLQLGNAGASGSIIGNVLNNGILAFNRTDSHTFAGLISGTGALEQIGSGTTILTAANSYAGPTDVREGSLIVNGDQTAATGTTTVEAGGILGGLGTIGGDVNVLDGGALNPGNVGIAPGTLTINGNLALAANATLNYNFGQAGVVGGAYNDLTIVHGDLVLGGALNVVETPGGNFGPGLYRVIGYDGTLTNNGLSVNSPNHLVQTAVAGQVNLVDISNLTLNFWDGDAGPKDNSLVNGGSGTWRAAGDDNWTDETGQVNAAFSNGSFAVFAGAAGTVQVDNTNGQVTASGLQFASSGYVIQGGAVTLDGPQSIIRVGDGTAPGAAYVATIASVLQGSSQLVKRDLGTLVLAGSNTYTGGTAIREGTVRISSDANLGDAAGGLTLGSGTLQNTAALASARSVTLNTAGGTFLTDADLTLSGIVGGPGGFTKTGGAALTLTGANTYAGPTTVAAGSLFVAGDQSAATGLMSVQGGATLGGSGIIGGSVALADGGVLNPGAADGTPGRLSIAGNLTLSGGSVLNYSFGEANAPGGALNDLVTVGGNLVLDGTLNVSASPGGTFGPGLYRVFNYNGTLTNNGLSIGSIPSSNSFIQTAIANQVNLVNTAGLTLNYWDGAAGPKFDGRVNGGDGVWQNSAGNDSWTDATGVVNAPYAGGAFAIFAGKAGTVTVDNSLGQVTASGMQFAADGYVIQGGRIGLDGPASTIRVGDGTSAGAGITATISSELAGSAQLIKTDLGTLILSGANSYSGGTAINGGTLQVSSDANLGDARGAVSFNGGTLHATASFASGRAVNLAGQGTWLTDAGTVLTLTGALTGNGSLFKQGQGTTVIAGNAAGFTGTTTLEGGTFTVNGSLCGAINVRSGARLQGTGIVCDTNNFAGGTVAPGNSIGTLTVAGTYAGSGGTLEIETVLGGDSSPTDRLVVTGDTSGASKVKVINLGGSGAQTTEGIRIIEVGGASNGTFALAGDYVFQGDQAVVSGAYAYRLYKNGVSTPSDGDWYLRSTYTQPADPTPQLLYQPGVPLYEAYAGVLQSFNQLGTLQQRVGNRSWAPGATPQGANGSGPGAIDRSGIWARIESAHSQFKPKTSTSATDYDSTIWKLQAGIDGLLHEGAAGVLIGGLTAHLGTVSSDVSSIFGAGSIKATGYGFGGTLTWYGNDGLYVDAQAQATRYDSDLTSSTLGTTLAKGNSAFGYALGLEAGRRIALNDRFSLTPQAQLAHSAVGFDRFTDRYGAVASLRDGDRLVGRVGLSVDYEDQWTGAGGQVNRAHLYGIANLYYDFLDGVAANVSGARLVSKDQALWGGLGVGASLNWADGRYAVFGEVSARSSLRDFGDSYGLGGKVGFNMKW